MKFFKNAGLMLASLFCLAAQAQEEVAPERMSCTSIMVGRKASTDGSVFTSHTCDGRYRTWMRWVPARTCKAGEKEAIFEGRMHTGHASDSTGVHIKGFIPQASQTYRFLDTAYPCLNEHQLGIGETTVGGRKELRNPQGLFYIEELERVALERCKTAREAIKLMGELVKQYGFADAGECLTIADPNEVWIFEIFGEGPKKIGGVWAAVRIPDDEVSVSANISRIGQLDLSNPDRYMASDNVFDVAKRMKLWDGKEPFSFWKAYSGGNYFGEPKAYSVRELYILSQLAPSLGLNDTMEELPLSVKPEKPVDLKEINRLLSSYYEGNKLDVSARQYLVQNGDTVKSPLANPWPTGEAMNLYRSVFDKNIKNVRTVSVPWCAYSTIIQLRAGVPNEVGGMVWMSFDNPGESPRFPIFCGTTKLPTLLGYCGNAHNRMDDTALWRYRKANRLATVKWGTFRRQLEPAREYFIDKGMRELAYVTQVWSDIKDQNAAVEMLNGYTADFYGATIAKWEELATNFWNSTTSGF